MKVFAHRGLHSRHLGENTLAAFVRAVEAGADGIEFDVRVTRDGVPVAIHDENLSRVAGDSRRVRDLTEKELQAVVLRGEGRIPTLNEITASISSTVELDIEIKDRDVLEPLLTKLSTSAKLRERTIISSFVLDDLLAVRTTCPDVRTILLNRSWPLPLKGKNYWPRVCEHGLWGLGFRSTILNRQRVRMLQEQGCTVASWDDQPLKSDIGRMENLGVDIAIIYRVKPRT
ncbi:MAG: glycerophosphodiester phosphodiesterase family protein [Patescibacteria group bacterium]